MFCDFTWVLQLRQILDASFVWALGGLLQTFSEVWTALEQFVSLQTASPSHYSLCDWLGRETFYFFSPLHTPSRPLVPHPSAGCPSHSLILPVPRWLLVGAMWLSSNEPLGINRILSLSEEAGERKSRENADGSLWSRGVRERLSLWAPNQWSSVLNAQQTAF